MDRKTFDAVMGGIGTIAGAVAEMRRAYPSGCGRLDELAQSVCDVSAGLMEDLMLGDCGGPEQAGRPEAPAATRERLERVRAAAAPAVKPAGGKKAEAGAAKKEKPALLRPELERKAGTCCDCGAAFEKTGNNQKRCAACAKKRQAEAKAEWTARQAAGGERAGKEPGNPAATRERLERIRAADKRLDTIPGAGGGNEA